MTQFDTPAGVISYDEDKHLYSIGDKALKSVTELAKEFAAMDTTWLEQHPEFAARGTAIHNELADYFDGNMELADLSDTAQEIAGQILRKDSFQTEILVYNIEKGYAGTVDLVSVVDKKVEYIIDFKSGTTVNMAYYTAQLNLYRLALESMGVDVSKTRMFIVNPERTIEIPVRDWDYLKEMSKGYVPDDETQTKIDKLEYEIKCLEEYVNRYDELKKELQTLLCEKLSESGNKFYYGKQYTFTYTQPTTRKTLDQSLVAEKLGDEYDNCFKESTVKATVRMTKIGE